MTIAENLPLLGVCEQLVDAPRTFEVGNDGTDCRVLDAHQLLYLGHGSVVGLVQMHDLQSLEEGQALVESPTGFLRNLFRFLIGLGTFLSLALAFVRGSRFLGTCHCTHVVAWLDALV